MTFEEWRPRTLVKRAKDLLIEEAKNRAPSERVGCPTLVEKKRGDVNGESL